MSKDDWIESSEGDIAPDLTEEAGYAYWEPPQHRAWGPVLLRIGIVFVLVLLVSSFVLAAVR